jgi:CDP-diacylglycerol--glycerol-3-phosphate 3-phosphatidyltransferase
MFFTSPTIMTWTRIVAIPLIIGVYYLDSLTIETQNLIATVLFVLFAFTDWLDGFLARKLNQTSAFGAFLDPVADKALLVSMYVTLAAVGVLPDWLAILVVFRDLLIVGGVIGAQIGTSIGVRLKAEQLRILLALLVLAVSVKIALDLLLRPSELYSVVPGILP